MSAAGQICPLCGLRFRQGVEACGGCPLHGGCSAPTCCPRCGYALPGPSATVHLIRRIGRRLTSLLHGPSAGRRGAA